MCRQLQFAKNFLLTHILFIAQPCWVASRFIIQNWKRGLQGQWFCLRWASQDPTRVSPGPELPREPSTGPQLERKGHALTYSISCSYFKVSYWIRWDFIVIKSCPNCSLWTFSYFELHLCSIVPNYVVANWERQVCELWSSEEPQSRLCSSVSGFCSWLIAGGQSPPAWALFSRGIMMMF